MTLTRTTDERLIRSVIEHPELAQDMYEGVAAVPFHDSIYYLAPMDERHADGAVADELLGIVAYIPVNPVTWNPHIGILPAHRGRGTEVMSESLRWMFENTPCRKVVAHPPVFNKRVIRLFEKCGFAVEGESPASFPWRGGLHDRLLMGIEKETICGLQ